MDNLTDYLCRRHRVIVAACLASMLVTGIGLFRLRSTVQLQYRFGAKSKTLRDYRWMEERIGPLVPLEIVLHIDPDSQLDFLSQLQVVADVQQALENQEDVGAVMSAVDFAPPVPKTGSVGAVIERTILKKKLPASRQRLVDAHFLSNGEDSETLWRITVRLGRQPNASYRSVSNDPLPLVADFVKKLTIFDISSASIGFHAPGSNRIFESHHVGTGASRAHNVPFPPYRRTASVRIPTSTSMTKEDL